MPRVTALRAEREGLARRGAELALGPAHPERRTLVSQLASVDDAMAAEVARFVAAEAAAVDLAADRLARLRADLAALERRRRDRGLAEIRLRELKSDLASERRRFDKVLDNLATLDRQTDILRPSARFPFEAEAPTRPRFPRSR